MNIGNQILSIFENNKGCYISGEKIAEKLNISRSAVWKTVKTLKNKGYNIKAVTNKGYILDENSNILSAQSIEKYIQDKRIKVIYNDCVTSTNTVLKQMAENGEKEGLLLVAGEQTDGKGRLGRSFHSQKNTGVYFSLLLKPELTPSDSLLITTCAAVAVAKAINEIAGKDAQIKWVNDIYINDKKVCGILTQAAFDIERNKLSFAILGIGINIFFPNGSIPDEIKNIAGSVFDSNNIPTDAVSKIVARTIDIFMSEYDKITEKNFLDYYKEHSYLDGKEIKVIKPQSTKSAIALGINDNFSLNVKYENGDIEQLFSGEVSTKIM